MITHTPPHSWALFQEIPSTFRASDGPTPVKGWVIFRSLLSCEGKNNLEAVYELLSVFYNYTGQAGSCNQITGDVTGLGVDGWEYQVRFRGLPS